MTATCKISNTRSLTALWLKQELENTWSVRAIMVLMVIGALGAVTWKL